MRGSRSRPPVVRALAALVAAVAVLAAACGGGSSNGRSPGASAPTTAPLARDEAVALALASDPRFAGIGPRDPDVIGQSAWYDVSPATVGWRVTVTKGWGDCPAGCIYEHVWVLEVDPTGAVTLVEERGDPVEGSGGGGATPAVDVPPDGGPWVVGRASAGPTCPAVREPPDPGCEDRPVAGAVVVVRDAAGATVAETATGPDGSFLVAVPRGGTYAVAAQPVEGIMGTPAPMEVEVPDGPGGWAVADLAYDTGIR